MKQISNNWNRQLSVDSYFFNSSNSRIFRNSDVKFQIPEVFLDSLKSWLTYRLALKTWGTKQQSAIVISSPTQNFPAEVERSFSMALKPRVIQCWAHSFFFSSPTWMSTTRFWRGWIPDATTSHISRTFALLWTSWGRSGLCGRVSSR